MEPQLIIAEPEAPGLPLARDHRSVGAIAVRQPGERWVAKVGHEPPVGSASCGRPVMAAVERLQAALEARRMVAAVTQPAAGMEEGARMEPRVKPP